MISSLLYRFLAASLLCFTFFSCEENKDTKVSLVVETEEIEQTNPTSNFVNFTITTDDKYDFDGLTLLDYSNFNGDLPSELPKDLFKNAGDSVQFVLKDIRHPQIMEIFNIAETHNSTRFLVSPGDTIDIEYRNGEFTFSGKNAAHYKFYDGLPFYDYAENPYQGDLQRYKIEIEKIYSSRKVYFESYVQENPKVSSAFKEQVAAELKFEYLYNLVAPRTLKAESSENTYFNNMDGISNVLIDSRKATEHILNLESYFDGVVIEDFQHPELVNNDYFKRSLVDLIRHYFAQNEVVGHTEENLRRELNFINENLKGELKTTATGKLIREYYRKGFGLGREDRKFFKEVIAIYKNQPLNPSFSEEIAFIEENVALLNSNLPEVMQQDKLVNLKGDTLTIEEVLNKNPRKLNYLVFWASNCSLCVSDLANSENFQKRITAEENIEFIYISVEENIEKWKDKTSLLEEQMGTNKQYKFLKVKNAKILSFLKMRGTDKSIALPKFTLIDNEGVIISSNAPRLTDSLSVNKLLDNIE